MEKGQIIIADDPDDLALRAAQMFTASARHCILDKGGFTVVLSGGSTPRPIHRLLSKEPFVSQMPWDMTHMFWVDERCVPYDHPYSNFGAARKDLIDRVNVPKFHVHPMPTDILPQMGAIRYQEELTGFFKLKRGGIPRFDLIILGIGDDGHTASLFPGKHMTTENDRLVMSVRGGNPDVDRITLTLSVINNAGEVMFIASGRRKADIVRLVLQDTQRTLPAQKVCPVNGSLTWLVDREAASLF